MLFASLQHFWSYAAELQVVPTACVTLGLRKAKSLEANIYCIQGARVFQKMLLSSSIAVIWTYAAYRSFCAAGVAVVRTSDSAVSH